MPPVPDATAAALGIDQTSHAVTASLRNRWHDDRDCVCGVAL